MRITTFEVDMIEAIVRSPIQLDGKQSKTNDVTAHGWKSAHLESEGAAFSAWRYWESGLKFLNVHCEEHDQWELVPNLNYDDDLSIWYEAGLHPRFSTVKALIGAKQHLGEAKWPAFSTRMRRWVRDEDPKERKRCLRTILEPSRTAKEFLVNMEPYLFANLHVGRRRYRVNNWWKKKFRERTFTTDDFFTTQNQELRRFMLRRGVEIKDVLGRMKKLGEDEEGVIYELGEGWQAQRYLFVKCPSTGQEYLLAIPHQIVDRPSGRNEKGNWTPEEAHELLSPKEARRWTFQIDAAAEFVKEA